MPSEEKVKKLKGKLIAEAKDKFPDDKDRQDRYVWGTIQRLKHPKGKQ